LGGIGEPGPDLSVLYVVATPIGNLEDLSPRAQRTLAAVVAVVVEDTRVTSRLLARSGIRVPLISHRAPVERRSLGRVMDALERGDVALVSDAGTPALSDPGALLTAEAWAAGHRVVAIPGPSAVTAALSVCGYRSDGFTFAGFLPRKPGELRRTFESLRAERRITIAFDSPHRILKSLAVLAEVLPSRPVTLGRELTKLHEEILRGTAGTVAESLAGRTRGEITLVVAGCEEDLSQ